MKGIAMRLTDKCTLFAIVTIASIGFAASGADAQTFEPNTDRGGSDYRVMDLPSADSQLCQQACLNDDSCRAWTYVQPQIQGPSARCWLKNAVPAPVASDCCTSGIKGDAAATSPSAPVTTAAANPQDSDTSDQPGDVDLSGDGGSGGAPKGLKLRRNPNNPNNNANN